MSGYQEVLFRIASPDNIPVGPYPGYILQLGDEKPHLALYPPLAVPLFAEESARAALAHLTLLGLIQGWDLDDASVTIVLPGDEPLDERERYYAAVLITLPEVGARKVYKLAHDDLEWEIAESLSIKDLLSAALSILKIANDNSVCDPEMMDVFEVAELQGAAKDIVTAAKAFGNESLISQAVKHFQQIEQDAAALEELYEEEDAEDDDDDIRLTSLFG